MTWLLETYIEKEEYLLICSLLIISRIVFHCIFVLPDDLASLLLSVTHERAPVGDLCPGVLCPGSENNLSSHLVI